jgi:hypothetical protein
LRLQLRRAALLALAFAATSARGEDRVTVRGAYYREPSTKVVQPMIEVTKDLPQGFGVYAHGLVDAITSPSVGTGVTSDEIFTEHRKEVSVAVGKTFRRSQVALSYRQSREPDYISHAVGLRSALGVWENSGDLAVSLAYSHDTVGPLLDQTLEVGFAGFSYAQALSPVLLAQVGYEISYWNGFLCNPYQRDVMGRRDECPHQRVRHAATARLARYFPSARIGLQGYYRFYYDQWWDPKPDPWGLTAHSVEGRIYQEVGPNLEFRLSYRYHTQGWALFAFCSHDPSRAMDPDCGPDVRVFHTTDEKFGRLHTQLAELKLTWEARALTGVPLLGWFALGAFEISYGRYFQTTHYRTAHLLQTGYSLPF